MKEKGGRYEWIGKISVVEIELGAGSKGGFREVKGKRKLWAVCLGILMAVAVVAGCGAGESSGQGPERVSEEKRLTVYTSHKPEVYAPIVKEFEERTGIWVEVVPGGTTELLERIREEGERGPCDVMFGGGVESYEVYKDCLEPYESTQSDHIESIYRTEDHTWTAFTELPIVLIYNNKLVDAAAAPRGFEDLFDGDWDGKVSFADPGRSGSSCTMLETMIQVLPMRENDVLGRFAGVLNYRMAAGSGAVLDEVSEGKYLVGITLEETAKKYIDRGAAISIVYPREGTSAVADGCAVIKGADHEENAKLFVDFIVSPDVQRLASEELYRRTVRDDISPDKKEEGSIMDFDLDWAVKNQESILERWAALMARNGGGS